MEQHADEGEEEEEIMWGTIVTQIVVRRYLLASPMGAGGLAIFCLGSAIQISCTGNWMELGEQMRAGGGWRVCMCVRRDGHLLCGREGVTDDLQKTGEVAEFYAQMLEGGWRVGG